MDHASLTSPSFPRRRESSAGFAKGGSGAADAVGAMVSPLTTHAVRVALDSRLRGNDGRGWGALGLTQAVGG
jgi:hypothetical protein